jgi:hypothetical protein
MHRSGTSYAASVLEKAGLFIGKNLIGAETGNVKGHFENIDFFNFHVDSLKHLDLDIDGWDLSIVDELTPEIDKKALEIIKNNKNKEWGWKDPRTTLFARYWNKLIPDAKYFFIYRNPWDVVDSLFRRANDKKILENPETAFHIWNFYNREIIELYKKNIHNSIIVEADDFINNASSIIKNVNSKLNFQLNPSVPETVFDESLYKVTVDTVGIKTETHVLFPEVIKTYNELRVLSGKATLEFNTSISSELLKESILKDWATKGIHSTKIKKLEKEVDKLEKEVDKLEKEVNKLEKEMRIQGENLHEIIHKLTIEKLNLTSEYVHLQKEIAWMKNSFFWKLRGLWQKIKGN